MVQLYGQVLSCSPLAYQTAKKLLPNLGINAKQQELLSVKVGIVTPLIERLATIT